MYQQTGSDQQRTQYPPGNNADLTNLNNLNMNNQANQTLLNMQELLELEQKYKMDKYIVKIENPDISNHNFAGNINNRNKEIKCKTGVKTIKSSKVYCLPSGKEHYLIVELENHEDYELIMKEWPEGSFGNNIPVRCSMEMVDYGLMIEKVDKDISLFFNETINKNLRENGIHTIERIKRKERRNGDQNENFKELPMNKLSVRVKNLLHLKRLLNKGIDLEWTSRNHRIKQTI